MHKQWRLFVMRHVAIAGDTILVLFHILMSLQLIWRLGTRRSWWRYQMETFSALLALCAGNSPVPDEFPAQRPVTWSFHNSFICAWMNDWVNYREASNLRRHRAHYDVTVMFHLRVPNLQMSGRDLNMQPCNGPPRLDDITYHGIYRIYTLDCGNPCDGQWALLPVCASYLPNNLWYQINLPSNNVCIIFNSYGLTIKEQLCRAAGA